ncbi:sterol desaturase family protein [Polluticaenibacter yanchengensis]|uniref:Sterol desaturase family protein n=1 Tax=Polluticaenibacter yanchengensis TaxID=3014562 RepID=A0ABT4UMR0_9BACT|nr:sterol desaturase family protein [Chitinophagaceae bacterium LY-5]
MELNYLAFVLPAFFFFCGLEYYLSLKKDNKVYHFSETISNLNVGIFERTCDLFVTALLHFYFVWLYNNYAVFNIKATVLTWILLFLATDLLWYWYHRLGHRVNLLWSAHVVHHQSDDFNYTVSARITIFQAFFRAIFWSFIPILGFPPQMITIILLLHGAYPFFTHTQLVGKLGLLEKVLVTPSHHRVHHSSNEKYLDKNFGDMLIIWDKIFGTFIEEDEKEETKYGITDPLNSYSFLWQHFHFLLEIGVSFKRAKGFKARWRTLFGAPEEIDPGIRKELEQKLLVAPSQKTLSPQLRQFTVVNTLFTLGFVFFFLLFGYYQTPYQLIVGGIFVLVSVIYTGAILEQRRWIFHIEFARVTLFSGYLTLIYPHFYLVSLVACTITLIVFFYNSANRSYKRLLSIDR